jgi:hypothetical protein
MNGVGGRTARVAMALAVATTLSAKAPPPGGGPAGAMGKATIASYAAYMVGSPPAALNLDPFYRKYVDAGGIPIVSSAKVPDAALLIARDIVLAETAERPDVRREMARSGARVGIMAIDEGTMDLPEQRDWKKPAADDKRLTQCERTHYDKIAAMTDAQYWNSRARGMGGHYTTGAAENLLGVPGTRYFGENILVHEFSHNILSTIETIDPLLYGRVQRAYDHAMAAGLWKGDYASVTIQEYWAEGTQFWFNSNKAFHDGDRVIVSDQDLMAYDPMLYSVLEEAYRDNHHIAADVFYDHPARLIVSPKAKNAAC